MGHQSRRRAERRRERANAGRPTELLRELYAKIDSLTHEPPRRNWELMLEVMGHYAGINCLHGGCLTADSEKVARDLPSIDAMLGEYVRSWNAELDGCRRNGLPISEPVGTIFEENECGNAELGQWLAPLEAVRAVNASVIAELDVAPGAIKRALDPWCGCGRIALDAVVHNPDVYTSNADIDLWLVRACLVNFRYAWPFTTAYLTERRASDDLFAAETTANLRARGVQVSSTKPERITFIGGRTAIICADTFVVDLSCADNWRYSWMWNPPPWQSTMKLHDFDGTYDEWVKARPAREVEAARARLSSPGSERLVNIKLDEAQLHLQMLRAASEQGEPRFASADRSFPSQRPTLLDGFGIPSLGPRSR